MKREDRDGIITLEFAGRIAQDTCDELEVGLDKLYDEVPDAQVVVDFTEVSHISSAALGILVSSKKKFKGNGGDIRLVITNQELLTLFETTLLNQVFEIYSLTEEAIGAIDEDE